MKQALFIVCVLLLPGIINAQQNPEITRIRVISYNIRMDGHPEIDLENFWDNRKHASLNMVREEMPTVMGIQEGRPAQVAFMDANLAGYGRIGVGKDDGKTKGAMNAIYYDAEKVEVGANGTFWLSETPDSISLGWDAYTKRTCTWGIFTMKSNGKKFFYLNTHLDHKGQIARAEGIKLIVKKIKEMVPDGMPVVLTADFNAPTTSPIFEPLRAILKDARETAPRTDRGATFNGFGKKGNKIVIIDHIFYNNGKADLFRVLRGNYGAPYISDHYPVVLDFNIN